MSPAYPRFLRRTAAASALLAVAWGCGFDNSLRSYLYTRFWQPFPRSAESLPSAAVSRPDPFAGMGAVQGTGPVARLRAAYQSIAAGQFEEPALNRTVAEALSAAASLPAREQEEASLIAAKIDLRLAFNDDRARLSAAKQKFQTFLRTAKEPLWLSEARGWLAHIYYREGDQTGAGKIYLDELNRSDSNLSRETLLNSLRMTYRYDGGEKLRKNLEAYFDTPEHAAFAVSLVTNPGDPSPYSTAETLQARQQTDPHVRVKDLLQKHRSLFASERGSRLLTLLGMRAALRAADPEAVRKIAAATPARAAVRSEPEFLWLLGSAQFLTRRYAEAERPLLALFSSRKANLDERVAAAYGLCGVYFKSGNFVEQIRMALWLRIVVGFLFLQHGLQKILGMLGGVGGTGATARVLSMAWFAGILELFGGLLIVMGLLTRPVAFLLAGEMAVAYFMVHAPRNFWPMLNGGELAALYCFAFLYLFAAGPGPWSVDSARRRR